MATARKLLSFIGGRKLDAASSSLIFVVSLCLTMASSASATASQVLRDFFTTINDNVELNEEITTYLCQQGIETPQQLGFLCNAAGDMSEGVVRRGYLLRGEPSTLLCYGGPSGRKLRADTGKLA